MKLGWKYKIMLQKAYFDQGYGITSYVKAMLLVMGITAAFNSVAWEILLIVGLCYGAGCWIIGRLWFHFKLIDMEHEVGNIVNPFVREMREKFK